MPSEHLKWECRNVVPIEKQELSPMEKRKNWWSYHKWHLLIGVVILVISFSILLDMLRVFEVKPDYQIAYVGSNPLPEDTIHALENAISEIGQDLNHDGQVFVRVNQYATYDNIIQIQNKIEEIGDGDLAMQAEASYVGLMTDISVSESFFFLLDAPKKFQQTYDILSYLDGTLPEKENVIDDKQLYISWSASPLLSGLDLGSYDLAGVTGSSQELLSGLYIARRGFWTEKVCNNLEGCEALWMKFLEGADTHKEAI